MRLRSVGEKRHYVTQGIVIENGKAKDTGLRLIDTVPPRSYIVAFSQKGLGPTYEHFAAKLRKCLDEDDSHVHGVCVLDPDWFAGRLPDKRPAQLFGKKGNGLLSLYASILLGQQNFSVHPMDLFAHEDIGNLLVPHKDCSTQGEADDDDAEADETDASG
jgi:hypothetical protein